MSFATMGIREWERAKSCPAEPPSRGSPGPRSIEATHSCVHRGPSPDGKPEGGSTPRDSRRSRLTPTLKRAALPNGLLCAHSTLRHGPNPRTPLGNPSCCWASRTWCASIRRRPIARSSWTMSTGRFANFPRWLGAWRRDQAITSTACSSTSRSKPSCLVRSPRRRVHLKSSSGYRPRPIASDAGRWTWNFGPVPRAGRRGGAPDVASIGRA